MGNVWHWGAIGGGGGGEGVELLLLVMMVERVFERVDSVPDKTTQQKV